MARDPLKLEEIVVTGLATGMSRRNLANSVASVSADEVSKVPATSIENALQGKVAGAQIQQNTGAPGGGNRIRLRGITSLIEYGEPALRRGRRGDERHRHRAGHQPRHARVGCDVASPSRARKARSTASPTSTRTTSRASRCSKAPRRPRSTDRKPRPASSSSRRSAVAAASRRSTLRTGAGTSSLAYKEGSRHFTNIQDAYAVFAPIAGTAQRAAVDQLFDPNRQIDYEEEAFGENPLNWETSLGVSGGNEQTRYLVSGLLKYDGGVAKNTYARKQSLRVNLDQNFGKKWVASINGEVLRNANDRGLFGNDNAGNSIYYTITKIPSWLDLRQRPDGSYPVSPFHASNPFQTIDLFQNQETVWRSITSGRLTYSPYTSRPHTSSASSASAASTCSTRRTSCSRRPSCTSRMTTGSPARRPVVRPEHQQESQPERRARLHAEGRVLHGHDIHRHAVRDARPRRLAHGQREPAERSAEPARRHATRPRRAGRDASRTSACSRSTSSCGRNGCCSRPASARDRSTNNGDTGKYFYYPKASASYRFTNVIRGIVDEAKVRVRRMVSRATSRRSGRSSRT